MRRKKLKTDECLCFAPLLSEHFTTSPQDKLVKFWHLKCMQWINSGMKRTSWGKFCFIYTWYFLLARILLNSVFCRGINREFASSAFQISLQTLFRLVSFISLFLRACLKNPSSCKGSMEAPLSLMKACEDWVSWSFLLRPMIWATSSCSRLMLNPMISWLHDIHNIQAGD